MKDKKLAKLLLQLHKQIVIQLKLITDKNVPEQLLKLNKLRREELTKQIKEYCNS